MTDEGENKATLLKFYQLFYNEKRFEDGGRLLAEDFVNRHAGVHEKGRSKMIEAFGHFVRANAPEFNIEPKRVIAEGDFVWVQSLVAGLPGGARAATVDIWRFEDGAIAEHWDVGQPLKADQDVDAIFGPDR